MHMPPKGKGVQTHGPNPLCVFRQAPKTFISSYLYNCIWRGRVLSNDLKNNQYTHLHMPFNLTLNHTTFESTFLVFKILSCFIQSRYTKSLTKHFNKIPMRE